MVYEFRWNEWNLEHIAEHGVLQEEAEAIVRRARPPFPRELAKGKYLVRGQSMVGTYLQAIFVVDPGDTLYVIHARPMTNVEKHKFRRNRR
jgi:uncharacterized DUF497 family protein